MRTIVLVILLAVSGPAFACPPTHYDCGQSSCCPR